MNVLAAARLNAAAIIDAQPIGRFQWWLLLACAAVLFLDGFDTQAIGYVAPAIIKDLQISRGAMGPVFSAGLIGLMLGALVVGPLADRIGRKRCLVACTAAFGAFAAATAFVDGMTGLIALRFLTGLGLGGAMPNAIAFTSEYSPRRRRATMVMAVFAGFSVGAAVGGFIAAAVLPAFGWRAVFGLGGAVPLLLAPILALRLPESARFLATTEQGRARLRPLLARVFPAIAIPPGLFAPEAAKPGFTVVQLFQARRAGMTLLFWLIFFANLLDLFFIASWLPTVLTEGGTSVSLAAILGSLLQVGGLLGVFVVSRVIDTLAFWALAATYLVAGVSVASIGLTTHSSVLVAVAIFFAGFGIVGGQTSANALAATCYPTALRATGVGWALGIGRIGSIVGPLVGGALLSLHWTPVPLFLLAAMPAVVAALAALALGVSRRSANFAGHAVE